MEMTLALHPCKIKMFLKKTFEAAINTSNVGTTNVHDALIAHKELELLLTHN